MINGEATWIDPITPAGCIGCDFCDDDDTGYCEVTKTDNHQLCAVDLQLCKNGFEDCNTMKPENRAKLSQ